MMDSRVLRVGEAGGLVMRRQGRGFVARCAFHLERTPSMRLDPSIDAFHCFGCGVSGGYVALARQLGVDLTAVLGPLDPERTSAPGHGAYPQTAGRSVWYEAADPLYPPRAEVEALLAACGVVDRDPEVAAWLRQRALDPATVADRELARALPAGVLVPEWAYLGRMAWNASGRGFPLLLPLYGATGELESVRARALATAAPDGSHGIKAVAAAGASMRGLVLADTLGRRVLQGDEAAIGRVRRSDPGIVIVEGEPDFLTWATMYGDAAELSPAVFGVVAGCWADESALAARIPDGISVLVATHHDKAGEGYAEKIAGSFMERALAGRLFLRRSRPHHERRAI